MCACVVWLFIVCGLFCKGLLRWLVCLGLVLLRPGFCFADYLLFWLLVLVGLLLCIVLCSTWFVRFVVW